jgi:hypothetical protein
VGLVHVDLHARIERLTNALRDTLRDAATHTAETVRC